MAYTSTVKFRTVCCIHTDPKVPGCFHHPLELISGSGNLLEYHLGCCYAQYGTNMVPLKYSGEIVETGGGFLEVLIFVIFQFQYQKWLYLLAFRNGSARALNVKFCIEAPQCPHYIQLCFSSSPKFICSSLLKFFFLNATNAIQIISLVA